MIIPNEILAHFNVSKRDESLDAGCFIKISAAEAKKNNLESEVDVAEQSSFDKKPKMAPSHNGKVAKRGWGASGIFVTRRKISDEEWEQYKRNADKIGNPLSRKELRDSKNQRIAFVEKYNHKNTGQISNRKRKMLKLKARKPKMFRKGASIEDINAIRERDYGKNPSIREAKQLRRTFSNIDDRQAMK